MRNTVELTPAELIPRENIIQLLMRALKEMQRSSRAYTRYSLQICSPMLSIALAVLFFWSYFLFVYTRWGSSVYTVARPLLA